MGNLVRLLALLLPDSVKEKAGSGVKALLMIFISIPVLCLLAIWNPAGSLNGGEPDLYQQQLEAIGCGQHAFYLDEVRLMESYLIRYAEGYSMEDAAQVKERLKNVYFHKGWFSACVMKDDTTILQILNQEYGLPQTKNEELLEDLKQLRFEREKVSNPLSSMGVRQNYGTLDLDGIQLTSSHRAEVTAVLSGTVDAIENLSETIELEIECPPPAEDEEEEEDDAPQVCSESVPLGKTITLKHEMLTGIDEMANYQKEVIYTQYALLGSVEVSVGDMIRQGDVIARLESDELFFRMKKENGSTIDPENYLYLYAAITPGQREDLEGIDIQLPLKTPYRVNAGVGSYDPFGTGATMHYGIDLGGQLNDPIYSATEGIVTKVFYDSIGGNQLHIRAENGYTFIYAHMNARAMVNVGDEISIGEQVGLMGKTGKVTGIHLHFEIRDPSGNVIDPAAILDF